MLFYKAFSMKAYIATSLSVTSATIYAFLVNIFLNYKTQDHFFRRFVAYASVSGIGLLVSAAILFVLVDLAGFNGFWIKIGSLPIIFILQYSLNRRYSFHDIPKIVQNNVHLISSNSRVAIVGGGFTGLVSAYRLAQSGAQVTIYEQSDVLGGLAAGCTLAGLPLERAYHFIYKTDNYIFDLTKELGVENHIEFYPSTSGFFYKDFLSPFTTALDLLRFKPLSLIERVRTGIVGLLLQTVTDWEPLQKYTAHEWLTKLNGKKVTSIIWEPLLRGKFDRYFDTVTMSWLWGRIAIRAKSRDISGNERLGYVKGGFRIISEKIEQEITKRGGIIKTSSVLTNVVRQKNGTIEVVANGQGETFDAVLFTTPSQTATTLLVNNEELTSKYVEKANLVKYLDAVVMPFVTDQKIGPYFWYNISDERIPFLTVLSTSALTGEDLFGGKHVYYIGAYVPREHRYMSMKEEDLKEEWFVGLATLFPTFERSSVIESALFRMKDAQHIVGKNYRENELLPYETPVQGVYLANFTQIYPDDRGVNFAVREGGVVANEILKEFSLHE
jgi:protoporphyrinogen oxidase